MKKFKGTQGNWKIEESSTLLETEIYCGDTRIAQAKHYNTNNGNESFLNDPKLKEGKNNANLIAAAPELLEALQESQRFLVSLDSKESLQRYLKNCYIINKALNIK